MRYAYSQSTNLFYTVEWKNDYGDSWPSDCREVEQDHFEKYSAKAPEGKIRVAGSDGLPAWADAPPPTKQDKKEAAEVQKSRLRANADAEIDWRQDAFEAGIATPEESAALAEWKKYRVLVMRIDASVANINWPLSPE